jgi:transposase InsO family protein
LTWGSIFFGMDCILPTQKDAASSLGLFTATARGTPSSPGSSSITTTPAANTPRCASPSTSPSRASAPSIGTVGDAYDNGLMESIIGLYKTECIGTDVFHQRPFKTLADIEYATAGWVDWWNNRRLHGTLGMRTPAEFEHAYYAALTTMEQPV